MLAISKNLIIFGYFEVFLAYLSLPTARTNIFDLGTGVEPQLDVDGWKPHPIGLPMPPGPIHPRRNPVGIIRF